MKFNENLNIIKREYEKQEEQELIIPPQYDGVHPEVVKEMWTLIRRLDEGEEEFISRLEEQRKAIEKYSKKYYEKKVINQEQSSQESKAEQNQNSEWLKFNIDVRTSELKESQNNGVNLSEEEKKLKTEQDWRFMGNWEESYRLAEIAKGEGIVLADLSREDYANYAILKRCKIGDTQLRSSPWMRDMIDVNEIVKKKKEIRKDPEFQIINNEFNTFSRSIKEQAKQKDRFVSNDIKIRAGTADSDSWLFFGINNEDGTNKSETNKLYLSLKDLSFFNRADIILFMQELRDAGYKGDMKTFQDFEQQAISLNDQVVIHGNNKGDIKIAEDVAKRFFKNDIDKISIGKDEIVDGKNRSYSQILGMIIKNEIDKNGGLSN